MRSSASASDLVAGILHVAGDGACSWYEFATAIVEPTGLQCGSSRGARRISGGLLPVLAFSVLDSERLAPRLPHWRDGLWQYLASRAEMVGASMKLLVCGGAGFIGSTFVRQRLREYGDEVAVLDKLTYAGRLENLHGGPVGHPVRPRGDRGPSGCRWTRWRDAKRSSTSRPRRTSIARSRIQKDSSSPTCRGRMSCSRLRARARSALPPGIDRRGLRLNRGRDRSPSPRRWRLQVRIARPRRAPICSSRAISTHTVSKL